jgi:TonB-linked SusC/RagA family outer membrane protein
MRRIACLFSVVFVLLLVTHQTFAQEKTISGTITSEDGVPLAGVTITNTSTNKKTVTGPSGSFKIQAAKGQKLSFTYVGFERSTVTVGDDATVSVKLRPESNQLEEVTVAMDMKRNPRELGFSNQKVAGDDIAGTQRDNFLNSLQGRVAGLTITPTTGAAGASSQIVLRGFNSLSLNNQPLFVVDGIILDNSTMNETSNGGSGLGLASDRPNRNNDYTNRIADLNPNDIESVTILKGPEATALYGSQAAGGAVVITTKKATPNKISVTYDNSFRTQFITRHADVLNEYMPGVNGAPSTGATFSYFGPAYPSGTPRYDNIKGFFRNSFSQTHNLAADMGYKNTGFRLSASYLDQKSPIPTNEYKKMNVRLSNTTKIGKWVEITPSVQYIRSTNDKPLRSAGGYMLGLYIWPVNRDITSFTDENGNKAGVFGGDPSLETDNPLFNVYNNRSFDETQRYIASGGINITPNKWLTVMGRFGYDTYNSKGYTLYHPQSNLAPRSIANGAGGLDNYWRNYYGYNHTITATAKKTFGNFNTRLMVGTMWQNYETQMFAIYGTGLVDSVSPTTGMMWRGGKVVSRQDFENNFSPWDSSLTKTNTRVRLLRNNMGSYNQYINRQLAYFTEVGVNYKNVVFLNYTHRFESSSIFASENRNYNYPGFSASAIMSDIFPKMKGDFISYWKLRSSLATTARLADPYRNQSVFVNNFASSNTGAFSYGFDNNNRDLKPETQKTYEIGTELKFLRNRLGLDFTYYNTLCEDQIVQGYRASYATGFILNTQNAGTIRNQGIEIVLDANPIKKKDFNWNIRFNFNHMWSKVLALPKALAGEFYHADTWLAYNGRGGIFRNGTVTTITGFKYARNSAGQMLINPSTGLPVTTGTWDVVGDRMPNFTLGTLNSLQYKNWSLSFLWDLKVGGDIFNATDMYLTRAGKSQKTADRYTPRVIDGVLQDGKENSSNPTANTIVVTPAYSQAFYTTNMPEEEFIEKDVNYLRLRDLTLRYSVPAAKLRSIKALRSFKSLSFFATGTDLLLITNYRGADPAVNGNTAASAGVGGMGFDYANLPAPVTINFGFRVGF